MWWPTGRSFFHSNASSGFCLLDLTLESSTDERDLRLEVNARKESAADEEEEAAAAGG